MDLNPVVIAIPMYFTLMGIELVAEALSGKRTYRLNDAVTNISTGTLQQMTGTFLRILKIGIYVVIYEKLAFSYRTHLVELCGRIYPLGPVLLLGSPLCARGQFILGAIRYTTRARTIIYRLRCGRVPRRSSGDAVLPAPGFPGF